MKTVTVEISGECSPEDLKLLAEMVEKAEKELNSRPCSRCNGEGNVYSALYDTWVRCMKCKGTGKA